MKNIDKVLLFYNPHSGNGMFTNSLDKVIEKFQEKGMLIVPMRADRKDLLDSFFKTVEINSYKKIIAAGGDGTINTVVNAMVKNDVHVPLAIFPAGTANDYAYYFDLPTKINEMIEIALDEHYTYSDVGKVGDQYFINVMAMGMLVDISQKTDPVAKNTLGVLSYYLKGVTEIPKIKSVPIKITTEDDVIETKMMFMLIMNGRSAGGFNHLAPDAEINDGLFDVVIFKGMPIVELAPLFFSVVSGQHLDNRNILTFRSSKMKLESSQQILSDVDGETGPELPVEVSIIPKRLKINTYEDNLKRALW